MKRGSPPRCRTAPVSGDRAWCVPALPPSESGPEAQVDVLVVGKEALVEPAELVQDIAAPERGACLTHRKPRPRRRSSRRRVGRGRGRSAETCALARRRLRRACLGRLREGASRPPRLPGDGAGGSFELLEPRWSRLGIVVQERDQTGPRRLRYRRSWRLRSPGFRPTRRPGLAESAPGRTPSSRRRSRCRPRSSPRPRRSGPRPRQGRGREGRPR